MHEDDWQGSSSASFAYLGFLRSLLLKTMDLLLKSLVIQSIMFLPLLMM